VERRSALNNVSRWIAFMVISSTLALVACTQEVIKEVPVEKIVIQEVIKEVPVEKIVEVTKETVRTVEVDRPVEVIKEVVRTVEVPGKTIVVEKEVVRTVEVPGETIVVEKEVIVEKEVVKTIEVPGKTLVVDRIVERVVEVTPVPVVPTPIPVAVVKPAPMPKTKAGDIRYATNYVDESGGGRNPHYGGPYMHGVTCEDLFSVNMAGERINKLAESWVMDADVNGATVKIRQNIPFHTIEGTSFGDLRAEDVAWSINDANPGINVESATDGSGNILAFLGNNEQIALDTNTVKLSWNAFDPRWNSMFFGEDGMQKCVLSKRAFDEKGAAWYVDHTVGTGPFKLVEWVLGDRYSFEAIKDHWFNAADFSTLTWVQIPDTTVKQAALEAGSADVANVPVPNQLDLQKSGFKAVATNAGTVWSLVFPGNLWEETHYKTGEPLERNTFVHDLPWIGNPWTPEDGNNPAGMDDMEQARLVREALAFSIDRDLINQELLGGIGIPDHILFFDPRDANWDPKWEYGYDPAYSESLLDKAGYPRKSNGVRFEMPMYGWNYGRATRAALSDALAGMFRAIGVEAIVGHYAYEVWRPGIVTRSAVEPWIDGFSAFTPYDWPRSVQCSSLTRGGKSQGWENVQCGDAYTKTGTELDYDKRLAYNRELADFIREQSLVAGVLAVPSSFTYNPNKIASWEFPMGWRSAIDVWANIVLK